MIFTEITDDLTGAADAGGLKYVFPATAIFPVKMDNCFRSISPHETRRRTLPAACTAVFAKSCRTMGTRSL